MSMLQGKYCDGCDRFTTPLEKDERWCAACGVAYDAAPAPGVPEQETDRGRLAALDAVLRYAEVNARLTVDSYAYGGCNENERDHDAHILELIEQLRASEALAKSPPPPTSEPSEEEVERAARLLMETRFTPTLGWHRAMMHTVLSDFAARRASQVEPADFGLACEECVKPAVTLRGDTPLCLYHTGMYDGRLTDAVAAASHREPSGHVHDYIIALPGGWTGCGEEGCTATRYDGREPKVIQQRPTKESK